MKKTISIHIDENLADIITTWKPAYLTTSSFLTFLVNEMLTDEKVKKTIYEHYRQNI